MQESNHQVLSRPLAFAQCAAAEYIISLSWSHKHL